MSANQFFVRRSREVASRVLGQESTTGPSDDESIISIHRHSTDKHQEADCGIRYDLGRLEKLFAGPVPNSVLDLLEIAVATFAADKYVKRDIQITGNDSDDRLETRNIKLRIPVLSPSFSIDEVEDLFAEMVSHMTRDVVEFEFIQLETADDIRIQQRFEAVDEAVSLLSDGLDSTGGIFYNQSQGIDSAYMTVNYGGGIKPTVESIADQTNIAPVIHRVRFDGDMTEFTQFSRGLLHLSFGVATAVAKGITTIQCFENGIMSQFVILQDGWRTTRTVSPHLLRTFNHVLDQTFPEPYQVTNPFRTETKTEIVNRIPQTDLVRETVSCPHYTRYDFAEQDNCGLCVPCLIRNIAILASNHDIPTHELAVHDSFAADFKRRVFEDDVEVANASANSPEAFFRAFAEIAYFCRQFQNADHQMFTLEYPELHSSPVYDLHRRFAANFTVALEDIAQNNQTIQSFLPEYSEVSSE